MFIKKHLPNPPTNCLKGAVVLGLASLDAEIPLWTTESKQPLTFTGLKSFCFSNQ